MSITYQHSTVQPLKNPQSLYFPTPTQIKPKKPHPLYRQTLNRLTLNKLPLDGP